MHDFDLVVIGSGPGGQKAAFAGIICATSPTLAESYKVAALDATNKMRQVERFSP